MRKYIILTLCLLLSLSLAACDLGNTGPHEHNFMRRKVIPASCAAEGEKVFACECGDSYTETSPKLDHTYGEWETVIKATMSTTGKATRECSGCGSKEEMVLEVLTVEEEITGYTKVILEMPTFASTQELTLEVLFNWALMNTEVISVSFNNETYKATRVYSMGELTRMVKHYFDMKVDFESVYLANDCFTYKEYDDTLIWTLDAAGGWPNYTVEAITKIDDTHYTLRYAATELGQTVPYCNGVLSLELADGRFIITSHTEENNNG